MLVSVDQWRGEVGNFNNQVASNFLSCAYDICSAYRKLMSVISSLFLASLFMSIINPFLLKSSYIFHSFRVRNILVSFLYLIIWYDFAAWPITFLILLSGDIETNPGPNFWTKFFNLPLEFKRYFSPQFYQNSSSDCLRFSS